MNWLDIILLIIIAASVVSGLKSGFARVAVGIGALLLAIVLGIWFYGSAGAIFQEYVSSRAVANILGFLLIFIGVILVGAAFGALLAKLFKWVGLGWLDRLLGGAFGLLRGVVISIVLIMALMAFSPKPPPASVVNSRLAPYVIDAASVLAAMAPKELKDGFWASYEQVKKIWSMTIQQGVRKPPTSEL